MEIKYTGCAICGCNGIRDVSTVRNNWSERLNTNKIDCI